MVESDQQQLGQNEDSESLTQREEIVIVPAARPPTDFEKQTNVDQGEGGGDKLMNGACVGKARPKGLSNDESFPLQTDIERDGKYSGEDTLPSPVIPGPAPPDGGLRGWSVVIASFLCNGIIFGTINSGGILFVALEDLNRSKGWENPASVASITLSLAIGTTFLLSMVAGIFTDKFGIRFTTVLGGAIATLGMFLSSMYYTEATILIGTMGVIFGVGSSLAYTPSLVILGHYFHKRLGIVNGFVTAGSSVFTILLTELLKYMTSTHGLKSAFQMLSGLMSILMICGFIFKPILPDIPLPKEGENNSKGGGSKFINLEIWKNKRYVIWTIGIPLALSGYFVPYVHLVAFVEDVLGKDVQSQLLVQCIGATSGVGRLFFGLIADKPWVNRIVLQQISFFSIGTLTMLLTACNKFWNFVVISLLMGLFDGCFISLLGPIAFDIVGPTGASQAIGCLLALCALPLTMGPVFAGFIYDLKKSYLIPFICAGIPPFIGGVTLFLIRCVKPPPQAGMGSPVRELKELKNNVAVTNPENANAAVPEAQALMPGESQQGVPDLLQVDA